jgi:hypothetical protein
MIKNNFIVMYVGLVVLFIASLTVVCFIPSFLQKNQIAKSIQTFQKEGAYPSVGVPWRLIILDNYTDALMVNTAYSVDSRDPVRAALTNVRYESIVDNANQITGLENNYKQQNIQQVGYERYWHGYLVFLRPLLVLFPYSVIRVLLSIVLYGAFCWFMYVSWKKLGKKVSFALLMSFIAVDFFFIGQSMQFAGVFLVGIIGSIYLMKTYKPSTNLYSYFFLIGGLTSFFDLLTAPLVSLGILLIIAMSLKKSNIKHIIFFGVSWAVGYLVLWFTKWLIVEMFFIPNAISIAFDQIVNRTVNQADANFSHIRAVSLNFWQLVGYDKRNKFIVLFSAIAFVLILAKYFTFKNINKERILGLIIIAIIPYMWYFIVANHSYLHVWYTYRDQFMSVAALILIAFEFVNFKQVNHDASRLLSLGKSPTKHHKD